MILRLVAFVAVMCFADLAHAQIWSAPANICTPDPDTIRFNRHAVGNGYVRHETSNIDRITLLCPVSRFESADTEWLLAINYRDSTGSGASAFARATLFRMSLFAGAAEALVTASSNSESSTGRNLVEATFTHPFDFDGNVYWVRIELDRTSTTETVIVYSVFLGLSGPSDIRLKHDIELLGRLPNGLGFYRFAYNGSDKAYVGVMAQEVQAVMPEAVVRREDGYLRVSYARLGFLMQSYEDWLAAGGKLPDAQD